MSTDRFKGSVHFVGACLAATMGMYNAMEACSERRRPRHILNACIYLGATWFEATNTYEHWHARHEGDP